MSFLDDICETGKDGKMKIITSKCAEWICEQHEFVTVSETDDLLVYDELRGLWSGAAEQKIKALMQHQLSALLSRYVVAEVTEHIRRTAYLPMSRFNSQPSKINLINGIFDADAKALLPHSPEGYFTYMIPVEYDPEAKAPHFRKFLEEVTGGDGAMQLNILEGFAYSFIPGYPIQRANMLVGNGSNGKSTLLRVLEALLGPENCSHLTIQALNKSRFSVEWLHGKLANIAADLPSQAMQDAAMFKALTGGDTVDAEVKRVQNPVRFNNSAKLWFSANEIPAVEEDTLAYFRRWNIWEFKQVFSEGRDVFKDIATPKELAGLFNMLMEVLPALQANLRYTNAVDAEGTRRNYLRSADSVKLFVDECVEYDPEANIPKSMVYDAYLKFCGKEQLVKAGKESAFWRKAKKYATFMENIPERGGPRYVKGQKVAFDTGASTESGYFLSTNQPRQHLNIMNIENYPDSLDSPVGTPSPQAKLEHAKSPKETALQHTKGIPTPPNHESLLKPQIHAEEGQTPNNLHTVGVCPECGAKKNLYEWGSRWYCIDCLNDHTNQDANSPVYGNH